MWAIGADDQVGPHLCPVGEGHLDSVVVLLQIRNAGVEPVFGPVFRRLVKHVDQIAAQNLQLGDQAVAAKGRDRHLGAAAAVRPHPGRTALFQRVFAHLVDQPHPLDHVAAGAAKVDGLAARPDAGRNLDDDHAVAGAAQPVGERRPGDSGTADEDGRLRHSHTVKR
jgi:hypothetical protein